MVAFKNLYIKRGVGDQGIYILNFSCSKNSLKRQKKYIHSIV